MPFMRLPNLCTILSKYRYEPTAEYYAYSFKGTQSFFSQTFEMSHLFLKSMRNIMAKRYYLREESRENVTNCGIHI